MKPTPAAVDPLKNRKPRWWESRWFLILAVLIFCIFAFYVSADWSGEAAWNKAQAEITAAGESLDPAKLIPPLVPDAQNFAALPVFQIEPDPSSHGYKAPLKLHAALDLAINHIPQSKDAHTKQWLPYLGSWRKGEKPDLADVEKRMREAASALLKIPPPPQANPTELFALLCPTLSDLRTANLTHPECRFDVDYTSQPAWDRPIGGITGLLQLAKVLGYEEKLALIESEPDLAFADLEVGWKVNAGLQHEPLLVSGLVSAAILAIQMEPVTEGLADHVWSDAQLAELDHDLGKIDFLADLQLCTRGEAVLQLIPTFEYLKNHRNEATAILTGSNGRPSTTLASIAADLIPNGWIDEYKADLARYYLLGLARSVDPVSRRVFPEKSDAALRLVTDKPASGWYHDFFKGTQASIQRAVQFFAYAQVQVDEARIACRLERYRLAHGEYPKSLSDLSPAYGSDLPHDVMTGDPYPYHLNPDGTYLLYSTGWNQKDDGGKTNPPGSGISPSDAPDWVWPNHPDKP